MTSTPEHNRNNNYSYFTLSHIFTFTRCKHIRPTSITLDGPTVNGIPVTDGPTNHLLLLSTVDNDATLDLTVSAVRTLDSKPIVAQR